MAQRRVTLRLSSLHRPVAQSLKPGGAPQVSSHAPSVSGKPTKEAIGRSPHLFRFLFLRLPEDNKATQTPTSVNDAEELCL